jgi:hypothetical protein
LAAKIFRVAINGRIVLLEHSRLAAGPCLLFTPRHLHAGAFQNHRIRATRLAHEIWQDAKNNVEGFIFLLSQADRSQIFFDCVEGSLLGIEVRA